MSLSKSKSWSEIVLFYQKLNNLEGWNLKPMISLVENIAASQYSYGIYPTTSHSMLWISQNPQIDIDHNLLSIEFTDSRFTFKYKEWTFAQNKWIKECNAESGFATFEHIMKTLKWFL